MKKNVGFLDANLRLIAGFSLFGMGIVKSSKSMIGLGAVKIATGISRFCPILHALKFSTLGEDDKLEEFVEKIPEFADNMTKDLKTD